MKKVMSKSPNGKRGKVWGKAKIGCVVLVLGQMVDFFFFSTDESDRKGKERERVAN